MANHLNRTEALSSVPGVNGWHRSSNRVVIRMNDGTAFTTSISSTSHSLRKEAERLRLKARIFDAFADDVEFMELELKDV